MLGVGASPVIQASLECPRRHERPTANGHSVLVEVFPLQCRNFAGSQAEKAGESHDKLGIDVVDKAEMMVSTSANV